MNIVEGRYGCTCDFCTGVKRWEDWCASCGNVMLRPDQHWENVDVCYVCEDLMAHEGKAQPDALECPPRPGSTP